MICQCYWIETTFTFKKLFIVCIEENNVRHEKYLLFFLFLLKRKVSPWKLFWFILYVQRYMTFSPYIFKINDIFMKNLLFFMFFGKIINLVIKYTPFCVYIYLWNFLWEVIGPCHAIMIIIQNKMTSVQRNICYYFCMKIEINSLWKMFYVSFFGG